MPWRRAGRDEVDALTGQRVVPVAVLGREAICDSRRILEHLRRWRRSACSSGDLAPRGAPAGSRADGQSGANGVIVGIARALDGDDDERRARDPGRRTARARVRAARRADRPPPARDAGDRPPRRQARGARLAGDVRAPGDSIPGRPRSAAGPRRTTGCDDRARDARMLLRLTRWTPRAPTIVALERRLVLGLPTPTWKLHARRRRRGSAECADHVPFYARWLRGARGRAARRGRAGGRVARGRRLGARGGRGRAARGRRRRRAAAAERRRARRARLRASAGLDDPLARRPAVAGGERGGQLAEPDRSRRQRAPVDRPAASSASARSTSAGAWWNAPRRSSSS